MKESEEINNTGSMTISHRLEELIIDGTLQPGDKVPSERQLSQRLQVSRPLVREALKELRGRGVIETKHGKGSFVIGMVKSEEDTALYRLYDRHPRLLYDLLEVRELLEGQAAQMAAERGTQKDFYKITKAYTEMTSAKCNRKLEDAAYLDHAFHRSIYEASHNPVLVHTLQSLMQLMLNSVMASVSNLYHRDGQKQQIDQHHQQIYQAIIDRQPNTAREAAIEHIKNIRARMLEIEKEEQHLVLTQLWDQNHISGRQ